MIWLKAALIALVLGGVGYLGWDYSQKSTALQADETKISSLEVQITAQGILLRGDGAIIEATKKEAADQAAHNADLTKRLDTAHTDRVRTVYIKVKEASDAIDKSPPATTPDDDWCVFANRINSVHPGAAPPVPCGTSSNASSSSADR